VHLDNNTRLQSVDLGVAQTSYAAPLAMWDGSLVVAFSNSHELKVIDVRMKCSTLATPYRSDGFSVVCPFGDALLCGLNHTMAIRMVNGAGVEVRTFVGHADAPIHIQAISEQLFVSAADDRCLKLWDARQCCPIAHIGTNQKSITAISANEDVIVFSLQDRSICVVDIRASPIRPVLGLSSEDHGPTNMYYDGGRDMLCFFGIADKDGNSDSLLFMDVDGCSRKYIYRRYQNFLHL
jgi:WD40 repeat protein